jgi:replicative DNA helicase
MANWELQLLASIVSADDPPGAYEAAQRAGIQYPVFGGAEARALWAEVETHYRRPHNFGRIPSYQSLQETFPSLNLPSPVENLIDLCEKVRISHLRRESDRHVSDYLTGVAADPLAAVTALHTGLGQLQERTTLSNDVSFSHVGVDECQQDLDNALEHGGVTGMPWPWARLNKATGGIQPGDYILVWALPKSMKTWFGLVIAAHLIKTGRRVLCYSKEMTWNAIRRRISAILAGVNYRRLKEGALSSVERAHYMAAVAAVADPDFPGDLIFTQADRMDGTIGGPAEVQRKVDVYQPHFVMLDSSYMLELPGTGASALDWRQLSMVNRRLKQMAKSTGIPTLAINQESERAAYKYRQSRGTASLAMNSQAVMDCDVGIRLVLRQDRNELSVVLAAARETDDPGFTIHAHAAENFTYAHDTLHGVGDEFKDKAEAAPPGAPPGAPTGSAVPDSPLMRRARTVRLADIGGDLNVPAGLGDTRAHD